MFAKQLLIQAVELYNRTADELHEANTIRQQEIKLKEEELEVKDRVDISLKEYMNLINERDTLIAKVAMYEEIFKGFELPYNIPIIPGSVEYKHEDRPWEMIRRYHLCFDVDMAGLKKRGIV